MLVNMNFNWQRSFTRKRFVRKAATIKIFEYSLLCSELKKQTSTAEKQYQELDKICGHDR